MSISNNNKRGEWAELRFMTKASEYGFNLAKPWGTFLPYDLVIDLEGQFIRIQVKSTLHRLRRPGNNYACLLHRHISSHDTRQYLQSEFDFLAFYIIPENIWYIIPAAIATQKSVIQVNPGNKHERYLEYREAWHLLRDGNGAPIKKQRGIAIHAMEEGRDSMTQ